MFALLNPVNNQAPSFRAIDSPNEAVAGEVVVETIPASPVWDATAQALRSMTQQELTAQQTALTAAAANAGTLRTQAASALTTMRTYRALATPTNAQNTAHLKFMNTVLIGLIRLQLNQLDGTD